MIVLVLVTVVLGLLLGLELLARALWGPDPDLEGDAWDPRTEPMCPKCGVRGGARRHIHPSWTQRSPR